MGGGTPHPHPRFNRLKTPQSTCQKVVNTNLSGRLKIISGRFCGGLRLCQVLCSIY